MLTLASSSTAKGGESRTTLLTRRVQSTVACASDCASLAARGASAPADPSPPRPSMPRSSARWSSRSTSPEAVPASSVGVMKALGCKHHDTAVRSTCQCMASLENVQAPGTVLTDDYLGCQEGGQESHIQGKAQVFPRLPAHAMSSQG